MKAFFIFLSGIIVGAGVVWFLSKSRVREQERELKRTEKEMEQERALLRACEQEAGKTETAASGLAEFNSRIQEIKEEKKQKILKELTKRGRIRTSEAADVLEVSRATAFRYLEELELEGKIKQIGAFGRNVEYQLKMK